MSDLYIGVIGADDPGGYFCVLAMGGSTVDAITGRAWTGVPIEIDRMSGSDDSCFASEFHVALNSLGDAETLEGENHADCEESLHGSISGLSKGAAGRLCVSLGAQIFTRLAIEGIGWKQVDFTGGWTDLEFLISGDHSSEGSANRLLKRDIESRTASAGRGKIEARR